MDVRTAQPQEYPAVGELTVAAYRDLLGMPLGDYADELRDVATRATAAEVLVAVEDGRVFGGVTYVRGVGPYAEFEDRNAAGIRMLAVTPAARGRGVGAALVQACIDRAVADGRARILLHTTQWMTDAHRLYERFGFRRDPGRDWEPEPGLVLLAYTLELTASR